MKNILLYIFVFLIGFIGVFTFRFVQVQSMTSKEQFTPGKTTFDFKNPSQALRGEITKIEGDVEHTPREGEEQEATLETEILTGESLVTDEGAQVEVKFGDYGAIEIDEESQVSFMNLIPKIFLVKQWEGSVYYQVSDLDNAISVRSLRALTEIKGAANITVDQETDRVVVNVLQGTAKVAIVDLENNTHVYDLEKGDRATIDNEERSVVIR